MKPINVVVTGESSAIKTLIKSIGYGPQETIAHQYLPQDQSEPITLSMNFGSLQVDEDYRIDFYGGVDPNLFDFVEQRPSAVLSGMMIVLDADVTYDPGQQSGLIKQHIKYLKKYAMVIGITGNDYLKIKQAEDHIRQILHEENQVAPVFSIDPSHKDDVNLMVESLLCFANPGIQENTTKKASFGQ